jgi:hypothetical protein
MTDLEHYLNSLDQKMLEHVTLASALVTEIEANELNSDRELAVLQMHAVRLSNELRRSQWDFHLELVSAELPRTDGQLATGR